MNKFIDAWYPPGWRWFGWLTAIFAFAAVAGSVGALLGLPPVPARMLLGAAVLLGLVSGIVITFARTLYEWSGLLAILTLVWIIGQLIYWSPYWVVVS